MPILELVESFKTMNRPEPARPLRSLTVYISESIKDSDVKF